MSEMITYLEFRSKQGELRTTIWDDGAVQLTRFGDIIITYHITREDAIQLAQNLTDVVAAYDATVDRYHDVCDEPVNAEGRSS